MDIYLEAITPEKHDCEDFDPKLKQKAVYRWYDSRYSDEAWDIYSKDWEKRILQWHATCQGPLHEAHRLALQETNTETNSDRQLESLPFGMFFLAHPIAAFSLWRVLQSCYSLDRAVCGTTNEVTAWQQLVPFRYLREEEVTLRWHDELQLLRQQVTSGRLSFKRRTWETKLYDIHHGIEMFMKEFAAMRNNFAVNLADMKFASWMIDRIEEDVGKRIAMITEMLKFKDSELAKIQPTESHEDDVNDNSSKFDHGQIIKNRIS
ncbi:hypothetical protein BKA64DRAFT_422740 [Cadophora sp. MPI-SDFR-AT-0126]|nr:hypothetical protein BKA64DRAFT_422740 [Leotiomycetes sp. MPI-SDFR-AT-0126]